MRYTIKNLRAMIEQANEFWPLEELNGYGYLGRFDISRRGSDCYPGATTQVVMYYPGKTCQNDITGWGTPSVAAYEFYRYLSGKYCNEQEKLLIMRELAE